MVDIIRIGNVDIPPDLGYTGYMRLNYGTMMANYSIGVYAHDWGYPIKHEWEIGLYLFKWYVGVELFK